MAFAHDIIKIKYSRLGYLPNYPYHLISDREMFDAFIGLDGDTSSQTFFHDYYPNPFTDNEVYQKKDYTGKVLGTVVLQDEYLKLVNYIRTIITAYLDTEDKSVVTIPDWIYTYMLGEVIYTKSEYLDRFDLLKLMGMNNNDNEFTVSACIKCYDTSLRYVSTLTTGLRPPTMFGEPHVIKQLRLEV